MLFRLWQEDFHFLKKDIGGEWETKAELWLAMDAPVAAGEVGELIYLLHGKEVGDGFD